MSIKKLFGSTDSSRNYLSQKTQKEAFEDVESFRNLEQVKERHEYYLPHVDYSDPEKFARYGSAYLYYDAAFTRIVDYYPYDGSEAEINKFYNQCLDIEKYVLDNLYPRTNGYINLSADASSDGTGWGTRTGALTSDGYGLPASPEHISLFGGPGLGPTAGQSLAGKSPNPYNDKFQNANIYDTDIYQTEGLPSDYGKGTRQSNLRANFDDGVTVEFWLKTGSLDTTNTTQRQVVFDMWNNETSASADYGRVTIELDGTAATNPFLVTVQSGTAGFQTSSIGTSVAGSSLSIWHHYALSFYNSGSNFVSKLYIDGTLNHEQTVASTTIGELKSKNMKGQIGALLTAPSGSATGGLTTTDWENAGKLSGSMDEFRYWKAARNGQQIGRHWFTQVRGGANSDIANTTLGVYYKFNEGISDTTSVDSNVLDYAGRVCNGSWTGYNSASRNVGSAIVSASAAATEYKDPIIRDTHPSVVSLKKELLNRGQYHDYNNNASFLSLMPGWVIDDEGTLSTSDLKNLSHIVGVYFDKLYLQITEVPKLRYINYPSSSYKPFPFAEHLPQSLGLYSPEIFIDATVMEKFANRDNASLFENDLNQTKNLIYSNLYNNLTNIFKSKGTEKAIRNVFRCFNISDKLLRLNINSNNNEFVLKDNLQQQLLHRNCLDLNVKDNRGGVVYQRQNSSNANTLGYISGTQGLGYEDPYGFTVETNVIFPFYMRNNDKFPRDYKTVSLFGMQTVDTGSVDSMTGADTTFVTNNIANFQVVAVKENRSSKNAYFKLTSSYSPYPFPVLTSSAFLNIYDNQQWNFSVRLKPNNYPLTKIVSASATSYDSYVTASSYEVIFQGINTLSIKAQNKFTITGSMTSGSAREFLGAAKRLYVGAQRTNLTGALVNPSDVVVTNTKYYARYIEDNDLLQHALDIENVAISGSSRFLSPLATGSEANNADILNSHTLALNWNFGNVTGSNDAGNFYVQDFSSGSEVIRDNFGWLGAMAGYQHSGYGSQFSASSAAVVEERPLNTYRFISPEQAVSSDMVQIFSEEDLLYPNLRREETIPNYVYTIEKSLYNAISEEMLDFLAGAVDFNDVIGAPVNRYRDRYKALEKLREAFFRRVTSVADVERYVEYYKWFDDALTNIISQLVPASAEFVDDVMNVVESHVLERNKYKTPFPTLDYHDVEADNFIHGIMEKVYPWPQGGSTEPSSPRPTDTHKVFWQERALRTSPEISSGNPAVDNQRDKLKKVIWSKPHLSQSNPTLSTVGGVQYKARQFVSQKFAGLYRTEWKRYELIKGGVNFPPHKNIQYALTALLPDGPVNSDNNVFIPQNVLLGLTDDMVKTQNITDPAEPKGIIKKEHKVFKVQHGRDWEEGMGYKNVKSTMAFPFNVMSSSVRGGFNKQVVDRVTGGIEITNVHNDVYGPDYDKPLQGPFTEYAVGGHQSRHIPLNAGTDNWTNRAEAWKIVLGTCKLNPSGAIGMVGPDYPYPEANASGSRPYPLTGALKAVYYRDFIAKRPVNIRNIHMTTGSTILGNYTKKYQVLHSFGAYANPRNFVEEQPTLPSVTFEAPHRWTTQARTILDIHRTDEGHFEFMPEYSIAYLKTPKKNDTIITTRATAAPGIETETAGYKDFRANEFSVYNSINNRNLTVIKPSQGPSGTISEPTGAGTTGIRVSDIHGKDYGFRALLARHSARFGRDSLFVTGDSAATDGPGASYVQLPSFQKVHRNNLCRIKAAYECVMIMSGNTYNNEGGFGYGAIANNATLLHTGSSGNAEAIKLAAAITGGVGYGFTWTGWLKFQTENANVEENIVQFGLVGSTTALGRIYKKYNNVTSLYELGFVIRGKNNSNNRGYATWTMSSSADWTSDWNHFAVTFDSFPATSLGAGEGLFKAHASASMYLNGVSQSVDYVCERPNYDTVVASKNNFRNHTGLTVTGWEYLTMGGDISSSPARAISASADEYTFWTSSLGDDHISELYNGGVPCDVTGSAIYAASGSKLWDWIKFNNATEVVVDAANPGSYANSNKVVGYLQQYIPMNYATNTNDSRLITDVLTGCTPVLKGSSERITYTTGAVYDNFNIQHQIPRASRQYAWINDSLQDGADIRYCGFQNTIARDRMPFYTSSTGLLPYFNFVTESGIRTGLVSTDTSADRDIYLSGGVQPTNRLNLLTLDPVTGNLNALGYPLDAPVENYFNTALNPALTASTLQANYLNALLTRRQATYGWTWLSTRRGNHPILLDEQRNITLSAITSSDFVPDRFRLPPLSLKGRTSLINFEAPVVSPFHRSDTNNITLKTTETNEYIYFNDLVLNNYVDVRYNQIVTPLDKMIDVTGRAGFRRNWLLYSQNVFPSIRNEFFITKSCDNKYWRDSGAERITVGNTLPNSFDKTVSQSAWLLDPPQGFLTRTGPTSINYATRFELTVSGAAGELQNTYFQTLFGTQVDNLAVQAQRHRRMDSLVPSGLYSRKHMISTPTSVAGPGIDIAETASCFGWPWSLDTQVDIGGGEALWEVGPQAGILVKSGASTAFEASASNPWFNSYTDFNSDLKRVYKGYQIIPEFRISENIEDYYKYGILNKGKTDWLEIVDSDPEVNSSQKAFYKDYSNSDFLQGLLKIKADTLMNATQIRLVCSAAIRYNPYKGFYPAQRTLDMVSQFSRSFAAGFMTAFEGTTYVASGSLTKGGLLRPLMQPLIAPGILYNSIKSGMAVDYPIATDPTKIKKQYFGPQTANGCVGGPTASAPYSLTNNWALSVNNIKVPAGQGYGKEALGYYGDAFWDKRLPFETIVDPAKYLRGITFYDMEPHPSASYWGSGSSNLTSLSASWNGEGDQLYSLMARNFFGEVGAFFLKDRNFSRLEGHPVSTKMTFRDNTMYGARIKLRKSHNGHRIYTEESGATANNVGFTKFGGAYKDPSTGNFRDGGYPLPQDPFQNPNFKAFSMYTRPSAFGPACSGRTGSIQTTVSHSTSWSHMAKAYHPDSFEGHNWSFTPPYYDGEAWVDMIFSPSASTDYNLESILEETEFVYWRADPGPSGTTDGPQFIKEWQLGDATIYDGRRINYNAMQLSASINLMGIERVPVTEKGSSGKIGTQKNETAAMRWVISPKFETPIYDFNGDVKPISNAAGTLSISSPTVTTALDGTINDAVTTITVDSTTGFVAAGPTTPWRSIQIGSETITYTGVTATTFTGCTRGAGGTTPAIHADEATVTQTPPVYGSSTVPRGIWHQFGVIEPDPKKGIFLEIEDIPMDWLKYHYDSRAVDSPYNNYSRANSQNTSRNMRSFTDLMGIERDSRSVRLGEIAEKRKIREAVVAIPYVIEEVVRRGQLDGCTEEMTKRKKFFDIPQQKFLSATKAHTAAAAGQPPGDSVRDLLRKMERYVLPPQLDFLNNRSIKPIVMYIFEFKFEFDQDDLSYIWQNTAPRDYKKFSSQSQIVAHELLDTELLGPKEILRNQNLRWMVFKIKQRAQTDYYDLIPPQVNQANAQFFGSRQKDPEFPLKYNWPYDYLSFIELIRMDVDVLFKEKPEKKVNKRGHKRQEQQKKIKKLLQ